MIQSKSKAYTLFPTFYEHPFIKQIATTPKWSISNKDKMPIDMYALEYKKNTMNNRLRGCNPAIPYSMTTLDHSIDIIERQTNSIPNNHAFLMNVDEDRFIILDIEPSCPDDIKQAFLATPHIYAETSLSKKGIHMVLPVPNQYYNCPKLQKLQKLQHPQRWFEIMFDHWITFTRQQIYPQQISDETFFNNMLETLINNYQETSTSTIDFSLKDCAEDTIEIIPGAEDILHKVLYEYNCNFTKTPNDYSGDLSRYTFAVCGFYYRAMEPLLHNILIRDKHPEEFSPQEQTLILYEIIKDKVPKRHKNNERRNGTIWLMEQCRRCVSLRLNE